MEEKANDLPSAVPFLSGLRTVGAVHLGAGYFSTWGKAIEEFFGWGSCSVIPLSGRLVLNPPSRGWRAVLSMQIGNLSH